MNTRAGWKQLVVIAIGAVAVITGCGGPGGSMRVLPSDASRPSATAPQGDPDASLDDVVVQSQRAVNGMPAYGVVDGPWQTPPKKKGTANSYIIDGATVPGAPDDSPPVDEPSEPDTSGVPKPAPTCVTFQGTVPPPCSDTGEFRRVFSGPNYSFALAHVTLPANNPAMPKDASPINGDTGFVYMEGWLSASPNTGNSEFGFQYSAAHNNYLVYYRTNSPVGYQFATFSLNNYVHYQPGTTVTLALAGEKIGSADYLHVSVLGTIAEWCTVAGGTAQTHNCLAHGHFTDNGWAPSNCCIFARMTTIGQTNKDDAFYDGSAFGPIAWSGAELARTAPTPAPGSTILPVSGGQPAWATAGNQNWPPGQSKVVADQVGPTGESDTIDLAKLPPFILTMNPNTPQIAHPPTTTKYAVTLSGATAAQEKEFSVQYGWELINSTNVPGDSLTVPSSKPVGHYSVGASKAATLNIGPQQGPYALEVDCDLFVTDAAGKQQDLHDSPGNGLPASDSVDVRLKSGS